MGPEEKDGVEGEGQTGDRREKVHDQQWGWGRSRDVKKEIKFWLTMT